MLPSFSYPYRSSRTSAVTEGMSRKARQHAVVLALMPQSLLRDEFARVGTPRFSP